MPSVGQPYHKNNSNHCLKSKENTENINSGFSKTSNNKTILFSKCATCDIKKARVVKKQEGSGILSSLGLKTPLSKIPLFADISFWMQFY